MGHFVCPGGLGCSFTSFKLLHTSLMCRSHRAMFVHYIPGVRITNSHLKKILWIENLWINHQINTFILLWKTLFTFKSVTQNWNNIYGYLPLIWFLSWKLALYTADCGPEILHKCSRCLVWFIFIIKKDFNMYLSRHSLNTHLFYPTLIKMAATSYHTFSPLKSLE